MMQLEMFLNRERLWNPVSLGHFGLYLSNFLVVKER